MVTLIVLSIGFVISLLAIRIIKGSFQILPALAYSLGIMMMFTAVGHFVYTKGMAMMMPIAPGIGSLIVLITGVIELLLGLALFSQKLRTIAAWCLVLFFICVLPANIYASVHHINYQEASYNGNGISYLWFRVPLQLLFIAIAFIIAKKGTQLAPGTKLLSMN